MRDKLISAITTAIKYKFASKNTVKFLRRLLAKRILILKVSIPLVIFVLGIFLLSKYPKIDISKQEKQVKWVIIITIIVILALIGTYVAIKEYNQRS